MVNFGHDYYGTNNKGDYDDDDVDDNDHGDDYDYDNNDKILNIARKKILTIDFHYDNGIENCYVQDDDDDDLLW